MTVIYKNDIRNRDDVAMLVAVFYKKIRKEKSLGPIFNHVIKDWDKHLDRLTDFWETNLLFVPKFKGNPIEAHKQVDQTFNHSITNEHFGIWLQLWITTIDDLFDGELATLAKNRARKMSTTLFVKMFQDRPSQKIVPNK
ncbi:hemoglobin [Aquimarina sp. MAR_2010_214]|uniref:group III truncated hemoglobin n=1 Tax=Aquimarina sp. MAR_2010_214 TaxID=1250026 RepID=UPI000C6FF62B|nr:group III truncated hemoglobin [Aquimarina sp. MAR_2010_214]PKV52087.1 hemoglobin [Aquimarina sp. MAR_2010_214]